MLAFGGAYWPLATAAGGGGGGLWGFTGPLSPVLGSGGGGGQCCLERNAPVPPPTDGGRKGKPALAVRCGAHPGP